MNCFALCSTFEVNCVVESPFVFLLIRPMNSLLNSTHYLILSAVIFLTWFTVVLYVCPICLSSLIAFFNAKLFRSYFVM